MSTHIEILPYLIDHDGSRYTLHLSDKLIGEFDKEHLALAVARGLNHRRHAERVLKSVKFNNETNTIEDTDDRV